MLHGANPIRPAIKASTKCTDLDGQLPAIAEPNGSLTRSKVCLETHERAIVCFLISFEVVDAAGSVFCSWCFRPPPGPVPACWACAVDISNATEKAATTKAPIARVMF